MKPLQAQNLQKQREFQRVFHEGKGFSAENLVVKVRTTKELGVRFGIVVSKKVAKEAVVRNRIKRVLKEALKQEREYITKGVEVVVIVLPGFEEQGATEVGKRLHRLFQKASLFQ